MPSTSTLAAAEGMPKFNTREIMTKAWAGYRKMARIMREVGFNRARFRSELVLAWAASRSAIAKPVAKVWITDAPALDPVQAARVADIQDEIKWMEYGDRIDWNRHRDLSVELFRISVSLGATA